MTEKIKRHYIFCIIISLLVLGIGFAVSTQETKAQLITVTEGNLTCKIYDELIESNITFAGNAACTNTDGTIDCFMVCGFTNDAKITCAKWYEPIKWTDGWRCAKAGTNNTIAGVTSYTYGTIKTASSSSPPITTTKIISPTPPPPPPAPAPAPSPTSKTTTPPPAPSPTPATKTITPPTSPAPTAKTDTASKTTAPTKTEELLKKTPVAEDKVGLTTPVKDTKLETPLPEKKTEGRETKKEEKPADTFKEKLQEALEKDKAQKEVQEKEEKKEEKPALEKVIDKVTDKITEKVPEKIEEKTSEEKLEPVDPVLKEVVCADITEKTKNHAEIIEFLKLMHKTGTYLPPKDLKCKPTVKTKWSVAVQMALTLADESCGLDVANMPSNQAHGNQLRNACTARALELGLIEKKRRGNISKVEFYELMMKGANLASVDELPKISYPDVDADSPYYDIVAQAKFYELVKTYKKKERPGYILPKQPFMLKDALHMAWKALKKSPILHNAQ